MKFHTLDLGKSDELLNRLWRRKHTIRIDKHKRLTMGDLSTRIISSKAA